MSVSHPFAALPSQSANPALHANPQTLALHVAVPFAGAVHAFAQLPQKFGLLVVSTHIIEHRVDVAPEHPDTHANDPPDAAHMGLGSLQTTPHPPQDVGCDRSTSHPFVGFESQSAHPASHVMPHAVPSHLAVAWGPVGHGEHDEPQLATNVLSAQLDPHAW
jgi:hypothetical protein